VIDEVRFETSKSLLQKPDVRVGDVAAFAGFDDQSNFTRMFRRVGGLSPAEFRKEVLTLK
jgi:two-component system response regulator YesN